VAEAVLRLSEICAREQLTKGDEIVCLDSSAQARSGQLVPVHALGEARDARGLWSRFLRHYQYSSALEPWIRNNLGRFDVTIVHGIWNYSSFAASRVLPGSGCPYFVFPHGMIDPWFRRTAPHKHAAKQAFWLFAEGQLLHGAEAVLFTSEEERREAKGEFLGYSYRSAIAPLGAAAPPSRGDRQAASFFAAAPALAGRPFLLFLGRIHPKKGCDLLLEGFAQARQARPELHLAMVGPEAGEYGRELRARAETLGIAGRVHWTGPLFEDAKWGAYRAAEAFVLPSHQENFGIAVAEALACGVPVLISNKVDIWREVEAAGAGLIAHDDLISVTAQLHAWIGMPRSRKQALAVAARALYERNFRAEDAARRLVRMLRARIAAPEIRAC
jgi:glycosyltransferase involved in cell wall biosynthesis